MLKRNWALIALVYLAFAEVLSLAPVPDLSLCLIQPEHSEQTSNNDNKKYCPAFHVGIVASIDTLDGFLERHDKGVIGAFTIVLAISTIGLWLATNNLWKAGEKQFELLSESAVAQSRDMQASMAIADRSAHAAEVAARAAEKSADALLIVERPYIFIWGIIGSAPSVVFSSSEGSVPTTTLQDEAYFTYAISNRGKLAAVVENISIACGYEYRGMYPPLIIMGDHHLLQVPIVSSEQDIEHIPFRRPWRELDLTNPAAGFREGLIFRVVITYRGPFTKGHETSQCWRYIRSLNGFAEVPDEQYTYGH
jgi:hypothetical protein